jgi:predicted Abi (CAAX) family protease
MQRLLDRLKKAIFTRPRRQDWLWVLALLAFYSVIYMPIGVASGFLRWDVQSDWGMWLGVMLRALLMPGLNEELLFRVLPLPHPSETVSSRDRWLWIVISLIAFVLYHLLNMNFGAPSFFSDPIFLLGAGLLGIVCTIVYLKSSSIWTAVFCHWAIVVIWLLMFGGLAKFRSN